MHRLEQTMLVTMRSMSSALFSALLVIGCGGSPSTQANAPELAQPTHVQQELSALPPEPVPEETRIGIRTGSFSGVHPAMESCDDADGCEAEETDTIQIALGQSGDDSSLHVKLELNQDFGHGCSFEGTLAKIDEAHWSGKHIGEDEAALTCTIVLSLFADSVDINSNDCFEFCGARAHMDASFSTRPDSAPSTP